MRRIKFESLSLGFYILFNSQNGIRASLQHYHLWESSLKIGSFTAREP